jgi:hypothetical protein
MILESALGWNTLFLTIMPTINVDAVCVPDRRAQVARVTHGRRLYDTLAEFCRIQDETKLQVRPPTIAFEGVLTDGIRYQAEVNRFEDAVLEGGPASRT